MPKREFRKLIVGNFETNSYLIKSKNGHIIIDPGDYNYVQILKKMNIKPVAILLTHSHGDHTIGIENIQNNFDIPVYISNDEWKYFNMGGSFFDFLGLPEIKIKNIKLLKNQRGNFTIDGVHLKYFLFPGHTPGSLIYKFGNVLFVGDLLFDNSIGRYDLFGGDYMEIRESLSIFVKQFPLDSIICPGHTNESTLKNILKYNKTLLEVLND